MARSRTLLAQFSALLLSGALLGILACTSTATTEAEAPAAPEPVEMAAVATPVPKATPKPTPTPKPAPEKLSLGEGDLMQSEGGYVPAIAPMATPAAGSGGGQPSAGGDDGGGQNVYVKPGILIVRKVREDESGMTAIIRYEIENKSDYDIASWRVDFRLKGGMADLGSKFEEGSSLPARSKAEGDIYVDNESGRSGIKWEPSLTSVVVKLNNGQQVDATRQYTLQVRD